MCFINYIKKKKHDRIKIPNMYHTQFIFNLGLPKYQYDEIRLPVVELFKCNDIQLVKLCNCND